MLRYRLFEGGFVGSTDVTYLDVVVIKTEHVPGSRNGVQLTAGGIFDL